MKKNTRANIFIIVFILINLALIIAYVVLDNTFIMNNNLNFSNNSTELTKNLSSKADLNLLALKQYNSNGGSFVDDISCPSNVIFSINESGALVELGTTSSNLTYDSGDIYCDFTFNSSNGKLYFDGIGFYEVVYGAETKDLIYFGSFVTIEDTFSDDSIISFSMYFTPDGIDDNFNSDDFRPTSSGTTYPNSFIDDDIIPRLTILSLMQPSQKWYNVFWNNYKINKVINDNTFNDEKSDLLAKLGNVTSGNLIFDLSSNGNLNYKIKLVRFDKDAYTNRNTLIPLESFESGNLTQSGGYLQSNLSFSETKTGDEFSFDFSNNDYAIFIQNNGDSNIELQIKGEDSSGKKVYINAIDESKNSDVIEILVNHIIIDEGNYIGEHYTTLENTSGLPPEAVEKSSLLVWLDASVTNSFLGNIWRDLSGNNNNFTLYNNPTINDNSVIFNGVNQYAKSSNPLNFERCNFVTVDVTFKPNNDSVSSMLFEHTSNWNSFVGGLGQTVHSTGLGFFKNSFHTNFNRGAVVRNYTYELNTDWSNHTHIFSKIASATGRITYINGNQISYIPGPGPWPTNNTTPAGGEFATDYFFLASRGGQSTFYNGLIASLKIYCKALTEAEIITNFDSDNARFGIIP